MDSRQSEMPTFELGRRHIAIAHRLIDPIERRRVGLDNSDEVAFGPLLYSYSLVEDIEHDLGRGRRPRLAGRTQGIVVDRRAREPPGQRNVVRHRSEILGQHSA